MNLIWVTPAEEAVEATSTETMQAAVFAGGAISSDAIIESAGLVVAADSGYDNARSCGVVVDVLVGDMDSISAEGLADAEELGVAIERYPFDKDLTDLEIAIDTAIRLGATHVTVYGGEGGSFGHLLGVALGLTDKRWEKTHIMWQTGTSTTYRALPRVPFSAALPVGSRVTVLPVGDAAGVTTSGLQWTLQDAHLPRGTTRGLSNIAVSSTVSVSVSTGALLIIVERTDPQ
jgi:thiamine pyrophosphokinase